VHLSNLRRKLDKVAPDLRIVHTVRGVGFRISNELLDAAEAAATTGIPTALRVAEPPADSAIGDDTGDAAAVLEAPERASA
jgi:DNA-binding winged helix-turn-helix (wHTH) protein